MKTLNEIAANTWSESIKNDICFIFENDVNFYYQFPYKEESGLISVVFNGARIQLDSRTDGNKTVLIRKIVNNSFIFL